MKTVEELLENNKVTVIGEVTENFELDHEVHGEKFYRTKLRVDRLSDNSDEIVVILSERLIEVKYDPTGALVKVTGQFRSFNKKGADKTRLMLFVFAKDVEQVDELPFAEECNQIVLEGNVCKQPTFRKTPLGSSITDINLAVNRLYGRSDYIPCIAWNATARDMSRLLVGDRVKITGRIQSREYNKKLSDDKIEKRTAYEVSIFEYDFIRGCEDPEPEAEAVNA